MIGETWSVEFLHDGQWQAWARFSDRVVAEAWRQRIAGTVVRIETLPETAEYPSRRKRFVRAMATRSRQAAYTATGHPPTGAAYDVNHQHDQQRKRRCTLYLTPSPTTPKEPTP